MNPALDSGSVGSGQTRPVASFGYAIFYVPDVPGALRFYHEAFGIPQRFVTPENDYGELVTGSTTLAFVSHDLANENLAAVGGFTPLNSAAKPCGGSITLVTPDVNSSLAAVESAGGTTYAAPKVKPWGQTVAYALDPFGLLIEVASPIGEGE